MHGDFCKVASGKTSLYQRRIPEAYGNVEHLPEGTNQACLIRSSLTRGLSLSDDGGHLRGYSERVRLINRTKILKCMSLLDTLNVLMDRNDVNYL